MSAERALPPSRSSLPLIAALVVGVAIGASVQMIVGRGSTSEGRRTIVRAKSPDSAQVAFVQERLCPEGVCRSLHLGPSESEATELGSIATASADEVAWTPDGTKVGFLINGSGFVLYDPIKKERLGTVRLLTDEASQSRLARGVTFCVNGRALTFDDCPRAHSGCRAGVVGVPQ